MDADEAVRLISEWVAFGDHRTGSRGGDESGAWLAAQLRRAEIAAELGPYTFPKVEIRRAEVESHGEVIPGVPLFDGAPAPAGVEGRLTDGVFEEGVIAVLRPDTASFVSRSFYEELEEAHEAEVAGVIVVAGDDRGAPILRNAERIDMPLLLPVIQVAPGDADGLVAGQEATLSLDFSRSPGTAENVVAKCPGSEPTAAPVVLMTPRSGWYSCAAERGGGIAVWLSVALEATQDAAPRPLWLVASGGHELHHYGLDAYLDELPIGVDEMHVWLHLGASIGAREPDPRLGASDEGLRALMVDALKEAGAAERSLMPVGTPGGGEARNVAERGGRFISLLGGHRYFHSPNDTVELAVDGESVARHAAAVGRAVAALRRE